MMEDALFWSMGLLVLGLLLLVLEVFVPSGGVLGILAVLAVVASLIVAFLDGWRTGAIMVVVVSVIVPLSVAAAIRWWPYTPIGRRIVLHTPSSEQEVLPDNEEYRKLRALVGRVGVARTKMLPSGAISIDGEVFDAVSRGMAIEAGQPIQVVAIRANHVIVQLADSGDGVSFPDDMDLLTRPADSLGLNGLEETSG